MSATTLEALARYLVTRWLAETGRDDDAATTVQHIWARHFSGSLTEFLARIDDDGLNPELVSFLFATANGQIIADRAIKLRSGS